MTPTFAILAAVGLLSALLTLDLVASARLWPWALAVGLRVGRFSASLPPPALPPDTEFHTRRSAFRVLAPDELAFRPLRSVIVNAQPGWVSAVLRWRDGEAVLTVRFSPVASAGILVFVLALSATLAASVVHQSDWADTVTFGLIMLAAVGLVIAVDVKLARNWARMALVEYEQYVGLRVGDGGMEAVSG